MKKVKSNKEKVGAGFFLILAGLVLLAANLNMLPMGWTDILFSWPMILVAVGVFNLFKGDFKAAFILSVIGGFFIVTKHFPEMDIAKFWPVLVILGGFMLFFKKPGACCKRSFRSTDSVDNDVIEEIAVFGGGSRIVESQNFKGGSVIAVFGGSDLSLEKCTLSTEGATLELIAVFGGSKLLIPRGWNVKTEVVSIFGGFDDKRTFISSNDVEDSQKTLIIKGYTIFGGGELRSV